MGISAENVLYSNRASSGGTGGGSGGGGGAAEFTANVGLGGSSVTNIIGGVTVITNSGTKGFTNANGGSGGAGAWSIKLEPYG